MSPSSPVLSPHGPVAHIHGGRRGGSSCSSGPCIRQVFAKAPHHGGSCPGTSSHRANSSSLVLGRKETKWSVGWGPLQLSLSSWCHCGLGAGQPHLMALALASGLGMCQPPAAWLVLLCRSQWGWCSVEAVDRSLGFSQTADFRLGLVVIVWIRLRALEPLACPLSRPGPRCRLCPQRRSRGCPRGFDC